MQLQWVAVIAVLAIVARQSASGPSFPIVMGLESAEVDEKLLSFTVDIGEVVGTRERWGINLTSPTLRTLASHLAPANMRVGGTTQDRVRYIGFGERSHEDGRSARALNWGNDHVLFKDAFDEIAQFADAAGAGLVFGLNAAWPRSGIQEGDCDDVSSSQWSTWSGGRWEGWNVQPLLEYACNTAHVVAFELGNEPNSFYQHHIFVPPHQLALDFSTLRGMLEDLYRDGVCIQDPPALVGPDVSSGLYGVWNNPNYLEEFALAVAASADRNDADVDGYVVDAITWHFYPLSQDVRVWDNATIGRIYDPVYLNAASRNMKEVREAVARAGLPGDFPMWIGETASVSGGGLANASEAFASTHWYLDEIGSFVYSTLGIVGSGGGAAGGTQVMRQVLCCNSNYDLIDWDSNSNTYTPRPDYWASVLWKKLASTTALQVAVEPTLLSDRAIGKGDVRAYALCAGSTASSYAKSLNWDATASEFHGKATLSPEEVTWVFVVVLNARPSVVEVPLLFAEEHGKVDAPPTTMRGVSRVEYILSSPSMSSTSLLLNDELLKADHDGNIPDLLRMGRVVDSSHALKMPPRTIAMLLQPTSVEHVVGVCGRR